MSSRCYFGTAMTNDTRFSLRLPDDLRIAVEKRAEERLRSINNEIVILLKLGLVNEAEESRALKGADKLISQAKKEDK